MNIKDLCLGSENLHPSCLSLGISRVLKGEVSEKNGIVPCPRTKNLDVEQLHVTLNTYSNTFNRATIVRPR